MAVAKISVGKGGGSGANAEYITRKKDAEKIALKNLKHLEAKTLSEVRSNAIAHAYASEDIEQAISSKARTHYRMILSWERDETSDKIVAMAQKYLDTVLPKAKAIIAAHQDTDNPHAHIWIDARQTDGKKIQLGWKKFTTLDEKFAELYDSEYGTNYAAEFKTKKEETLKHKKEMKKWRTKKAEIENKSELEKQVEVFINGKVEELPPKPERSARSKDKFDKNYWQEKEINKLGAVKTNEQEESRKSDRDAQGTDRNAELSEYQTRSPERLSISAEHRLQKSHEGVERSQRNFNPAEQDSFGTAQRISIETRPDGGTLREGGTDSEIQQGNQYNPAKDENVYQRLGEQDKSSIRNTEFASAAFEVAKSLGREFYRSRSGEDSGNQRGTFEQIAGTIEGIEIPRTIEIEPIELPNFEINNSQLLITDIMKMMNEYLEQENRQMSDRATQILIGRLESNADIPASPEQITTANIFNENQTTSDNEMNLENKSKLEASHEILSKVDDKTCETIFDKTIDKYEAEAKQEVANEKIKQKQHEMEMGEGMAMF